MRTKSVFTLMGVLSKKGSFNEATSGRNIEFDYTELHVLSALDSAKGAVGNTVQIFKIPDSDKHDKAAKNLVGKQIEIEFELISDGKGTTAKLVPISFVPVTPVKVA